MLVRDVMSPAPVIVGAEATETEAADTLARHGISTLPVTDTRGKLVGVVSEADLLRGTFETDPRTQVRPVTHHAHQEVRYVRDVMTRRVIAVRPDSDVAEAAGLMTSRRFGSLPVLDEEGRPVGMVSRSDLVRARARPDADVRRDVDEALAGVGQPRWRSDVRDGRVRVRGPLTQRERSLAAAVACGVRGVVAYEEVTP